MTAARRWLTAGAVVTLVATGVTTWVQLSDDRWSGGEPGVVIQRSALDGSPGATPSVTPSPTPSPSPSPESTGPDAVFPVPHLPSAGTGQGSTDGGTSGQPSDPTPARSGAPDQPGNGGAPGKNER